MTVMAGIVALAALILGAFLGFATGATYGARSMHTDALERLIDLEKGSDERHIRGVRRARFVVADMEV